MTFEEQFPRLAVYTIDDFKDVNDLKSAEWVFKWQIEKNCLDKKRVREAIEKCIVMKGSIQEQINPYVLLKELGL